MSLLQLPAETLIQIFDDLGSSYFRSDLSRCTVCKQWSKFAFTACFRHFHVTQKTLRRSLALLYVESSLPIFKDSVEILGLDLNGFEDWNSIPLSQDDWQVENVRNRVSGYYWREREVWTTELNHDLLCLATTIKHSRKLRILRIQANSELHPRLLLDRRDYLFFSAIHTLISASNITSLELDLCGTNLITGQSQENNEGPHICTSIAVLLTTLRRLRLRMRIICTDVLKPQQQSTNLRLNEVLINLSLTNESPLTTSAAHARSCGSSTGCGSSRSTTGFLQLKADLEEQAQVLAAQMAAPKIVRIVTHALPSIQMRAFDVLAGRNLTLKEGADWDDDGKTFEEQVSDEETEISDLSSSDGWIATSDI